MPADIQPYWLDNRRERAAPRKRSRGKGKRYRMPRGFALPKARSRPKITPRVKRISRDTRFIREGAGEGYRRGKEARDAVRSVREDAKNDEAVEE